MTNRVDLDEASHNMPPHQDLRCLYIRLFSSLALKLLMKSVAKNLLNLLANIVHKCFFFPLARSCEKCTDSFIR